MSQCWPVAKMWHRPYRELFFGSQTFWRRSANAHWLYLGCLGIAISCCSLLISQRTRKERMYHFCIELSKAAAHLLSGLYGQYNNYCCPSLFWHFVLCYIYCKNETLRKRKERRKNSLTSYRSIFMHLNVSCNNLNKNEAIHPKFVHWISSTTLNATQH